LTAQAETLILFVKKIRIRIRIRIKSKRMSNRTEEP